MNLIFFCIGLVGVLSQIFRRAYISNGDTFAAFGTYLKDHQITTTLAVLLYCGLIGMWWSIGIDWLDLLPGKLNAFTFLVGYFSQEIFDSYIGKKFKKENSNTEPQPPKD